MNTPRSVGWALFLVVACGDDGMSASSEGSSGGTGSASDGPGPGPGPGSNTTPSSTDGTTDTSSTDSDTTEPPPPGSCGLDESRIRITDVDVGEMVQNNEDERALEPIAIAPIPAGGSRVAWKSGASVRIVELDAEDQVVGAPIGVDANSFADLHADDEGGVVLVSRNAAGEGERFCGTLTNLCGQVANLPDEWSCWDMYLVRFDDSGETWAAKLTDSSADHPPYLNDPSDPENVVFIWEAYAHHGRIASDGERWAAYFGAAISVSQECVDPKSALPTAVNIHQGDRMQVVGADGSLQDGGFGWGCSHSGYERVIWDGDAGSFVAVCKTDNENRIAMPAPYRTIRPIDLWYSNLGNLVTAGDGGYWVVASDIRPGQPEASEGLADVHLLHWSGDGEADMDVVVASESNARAPHVAAYGSDRLIVAWESSSSPGDLDRDDPERALHLQTRARDTGEAEGDPVTVAALGNRYHELRAFPDGSVAFTAPADSSTAIRIVRVLPCE